MTRTIGVEGMTGADLHRELDAGGKFVIYQYCILVIILTFRRSSAVYFVRVGENVVMKGMPYTLLTLVAGWWGIAWGLVYSAEALGG